MIRSFCIAAMFIVFAGSCSRPTDVAVTETGNPTKVSLSYRVADSSAGLPKAVTRNSTPTAVTLTRAVLVIAEAALESSTGVDSLSFESEVPYVLDLDMSGATILFDSLAVINGGLYDELEFSIEALEDSGLAARYPDMANKSIRIEGYCNGDSLQSFVFDSELSAAIARSFESPVTLSDNRDHNVIIKIDTNIWFADSAGGILDPRLMVNRDRIEDNIAESFSVLEEVTNE